MHYRQQNKCYPPRRQIVKFGGNIYFAGDGTYDDSAPSNVNKVEIVRPMLAESKKVFNLK